MKWKHVLGILMGICFYHAGKELYEFVYERIPPIKVGHCIEVDGFVGKVIENDIKNQVTTFRFFVPPRFVNLQLSFAELRYVEPAEVECYEETN